jgi:hypothetical protein
MYIGKYKSEILAGRLLHVNVLLRQHLKNRSQIQFIQIFLFIDLFGVHAYFPVLETEYSKGRVPYFGHYVRLSD